jgi:glycosyltransferase involved in cell wall biosynthesis
MTILLLMKQISRSSGGLSSALDLAETMWGLNHDVYVFISTPPSPGRKHQTALIPNHRICQIPATFTTLGTLLDHSFIDILMDRKASMRRRIGRCLSFCRRDNSEQRFVELLMKADLIFDFENFTANAIKRIRQLSNAMLIRNHAGSPDTFENYWVQNEHLLTPQSNSALRYIEYCKRYDMLLFQAKDQADDCARRDAALEKMCYVLSPSCAERDVLAAKQWPNPYSLKKKALVSVGSLQPRKAQHLTLEAFKVVHDAVTDAELHFVGGGEKTEYGKSIQTRIHQLGLEECVFIHGFQSDYLRWMSHAQAFVQTSLSEGVSRVLRESMLMRLPIVSFAISGTTSILRADEDALLIESGNIPELISALRRILDDEALARRISDSAFSRYLSNHSWSRYADAVNQMISHFQQG